MSIESDTPPPGPFTALRDIFDAQMSRQLSTVVAGIQATHYANLRAGGINEETAAMLTERTTVKLIETMPGIMHGLAQLVDAAGATIKPIIENIDELQNAVQAFVEFSEESRRR